MHRCHRCFYQFFSVLLSLRKKNDFHYNYFLPLSLSAHCTSLAICIVRFLLFILTKNVCPTNHFLFTPFCATTVFSCVKKFVCQSNLLNHFEKNSHSFLVLIGWSEHTLSINQKTTFENYSNWLNEREREREREKTIQKEKFFFVKESPCTIDGNFAFF